MQLPSWGSAAGSSVHRESSASEAPRPPHPPSALPPGADVSTGVAPLASCPVLTFLLIVCVDSAA